MTAAKIKLTIEKGATFRKVFRWKSGGVPVDLTGCTGRMQVRPSPTSSTVLATLTTENGGLVLGGVDGTISMYLPDTLTTGLAGVVASYDLELILVNHDVKRFAEGPVTLKPEVTRG